MRNHILFIVENNTVPFDVRVWNEALAAKEIGYDVTVLSPASKKSPLKYEKIEGIEVYRHPMPIEAAGKFAFIFEYLNSIIWQFFYSLKIHIRKPFHIIHAANPPDLIFLTALLFKPFGIKFIFDHHDICPENYVAKFGKKDLLYKILLLMEKLSFKTANVVISTNESYKKVALDRGGKNKEDVFVVRNGPNLSKVFFPGPNEKWKDGLDHLVAYIGVIGNQECIDVMLRIAEYIVYKKGIKTVKFIIIGTGPDWQNMVRLAEKMNLNQYVQFTGFIPYRQVYEIFSTADICINPEHSDSFTDKSTMIKIMDYMTFGKPIVQFNTKEGKVTAGDSSIYINDNDEAAFAEAILQLISDSRKRKQMGDIGKERIEKGLQWKHQKAVFKKAYNYLELKKVKVKLTEHGFS